MSSSAWGPARRRARRSGSRSSVAAGGPRRSRRPLGCEPSPGQERVALPQPGLAVDIAGGRHRSSSGRDVREVLTRPRRNSSVRTCSIVVRLAKMACQLSGTHREPMRAASVRRRGSGMHRSTTNAVIDSLRCCRPEAVRRDGVSGGSARPGRSPGHVRRIVRPLRNLAARLAVVTGAGSGIGRALAHHSSTPARSSRSAISTLTRWRSPSAVPQPPAGSRRQLDGRRRGRPRRARRVRRCRSPRSTTPTSIDLLFNNAAVGGGESFLESAEAEWDRTFAISWGGTYRTTRAFMPMLLASTSADIVNISSMNGFWAELGPGVP